VLVASSNMGPSSETLRKSGGTAPRHRRLLHLQLQM
jgi:hypothetical protein